MPPLLTVLRGAQLPLAAGEKEMLGSRCDRFTQRLRGMGISLHHYSATNAGSPRRLRPERAGRVYYGAVFPRSKEEIPNKSSAFWLSDDAFNEIFHPIAVRLLEKCDAVLRVGGASAGADEMVRVGQSRGLKIYKTLAEIPAASQ